MHIFRHISPSRLQPESLCCIDLPFTVDSEEEPQGLRVSFGTRPTCKLLTANLNQPLH